MSKAFRNESTDSELPGPSRDYPREEPESLVEVCIFWKIIRVIVRCLVRLQACLWGQRQAQTHSHSQEKEHLQG